jgi:hypothetical protein
MIYDIYISKYYILGGASTIQVLLNSCNVYKINPSIATVKFQIIILNKNKIKIQ